MPKVSLIAVRILQSANDNILCQEEGESAINFEIICLSVALLRSTNLLLVDYKDNGIVEKLQNDPNNLALIRS